MIVESWLDFDKYIVAQASLEMLLYCLNTAKTKSSYWQWIYITLHSAVQSFMVLALTGSNSLLTYRDKDAKKWLISYTNKSKLPNCHLDDFLSLYSKIKSDRFLLYGNTQKFCPSESIEISITRLHKLRNDLVHYKYGGLMIIMSDTPYQLVIDCLDFIEFLAFQSNNVFWSDKEQKDDIEELLNNCKSIVST